MIVPQSKNSHNHKMFLVYVLVMLFFFAAATADELQLNAPLIPEYTFLKGVENASTVGATVAGNFVFTADVLRIWGLDMRRAANDQVPFQYALSNVTMMWSWCENITSVDSCHLYAIAGPVVAMFSMDGSSVWLTSIVNST
ncbi:GPI-anchored surface protein, putative, partial [Bodo saltans]